MGARRDVEALLDLDDETVRERLVAEVDQAIVGSREIRAAAAERADAVTQV